MTATRAAARRRPPGDDHDARHHAGAGHAGRAGLVAAGGRGGARGPRAARVGRRGLVVPLRARHPLRRRRARGRGGRGGESPDARAERCRTICAGRSSSRRCGRGRCRSTSGSAAWPRGRRSSRWPPISRATSGRPRSRARSRSRAVLPAPALLIADLGRPARFLNMLRIFKPRSPMNMGAWCLVAFTAVGAGAVGADLLGRPPHGAPAGRRQRAARRLPRLLHRRAAGGHRRAGVGAQPHLPRAHLRLDRHSHRRRRHAPDAGGHRAAPAGHPTRRALGRLEAGAMLAELTLSTVNERRLGRVGEVFSRAGRGRLFRTAKRLVGAGARAERARPAPRQGRSASTWPASCTWPAGSPSASRGSRRGRRRPATTRPSPSWRAAGPPPTSACAAARSAARSPTIARRAHRGAAVRGGCVPGAAAVGRASLLVERLTS